MRFIGLFLVAVAATGWCGCLEMPISIVEKTGGPIVSLDAGPDAEDHLTVCLRCIQAPEEPGPGCSIPYTACVENEQCKLILECGIQMGCFQGPRKGFLACGLGCLMAGGVKTPDDKTLNAASNAFQCFANGACANSCFDPE
ncbi:MAG: hypothetical protein ABW133_13350 [Polyangiaceae bacterium]